MSTNKKEGLIFISIGLLVLTIVFLGLGIDIEREKVELLKEENAILKDPNISYLKDYQIEFVGDSLYIHDLNKIVGRISYDSTNQLKILLDSLNQ